MILVFEYRKYIEIEIGIFMSDQISFLDRMTTAFTNGLSQANGTHNMPVDAGLKW